LNILKKSGINGFLEAELNYDKVQKEKLDKKVQVIGIIVICTVLSVGLLSVFGAAVFSNRIANVLARMAEYARNIAEGNLKTAKIEVKSQDDIFILAQTFNKMSENLRNIIGKININSGEVARSVGTLKIALEQNSKAIEQIATSIQHVSGGAIQQLNASKESEAVITKLHTGVIPKFINITTIRFAISTPPFE
jgi:methyl-accepting chemotaxis protein